MLISKFGQGEGAVAWLEDRIGCQLPADYASFLRTYNGGLTYKTEVKVGRKRDDIVAFYGVGSMDDHYTFDKLDALGLLTDFLAGRMLPIACNSGGDKYALYLGEDDFGAIYRHYHDLLGKKKRLFDHFSDFVASGKSQRLGPIKTIAEREAIAIANGYGNKIQKLLPVWQEEIEKLSKLVQEEVVLPSTKE